MLTLKNRISLLEKKRQASMPTIPALIIVVEKNSEPTPEQLAEIKQAEKEGRKVMEIRIV